jgi:hypothetical protein
MFLGGTWKVKISQAKVKRKAVPAFRITESQHRECTHCGAESFTCSQLSDIRIYWLLWNLKFHYQFHTDKIQDSGFSLEVDKYISYFKTCLFKVHFNIIFSFIP